MFGRTGPPTLGGAILDPTMQQNATAAGSLPRTPLGELTALPRLAGFKRAKRVKGKAGCADRKIYCSIKLPKLGLHVILNQEIEAVFTLRR